MDTSTVRVRGEAIVVAEPDEVQLGLEVTGLFSTPSKALDDVARRSEILEGILDELSIPATAKTTAGASVKEQREYENGNYVHRGYRADNSISVTLKDPTLIGRLMKEATNKANTRVKGPWWHVALDNPARAEACRRAAENARSKAEAYAQALEARLGAILEVTEPGLHRTSDGAPYSAAAAGPATAIGEPEIEVHGGRLEIGAEVEVTFRLEQG